MTERNRHSESVGNDILSSFLLGDYKAHVPRTIGNMSVGQQSRSPPLLQGIDPILLLLPLSPLPSPCLAMYRSYRQEGALYFPRTATSASRRAWALNEDNEEDGACFSLPLLILVQFLLFGNSTRPSPAEEDSTIRILENEEKEEEEKGIM